MRSTLCLCLVAFGFTTVIFAFKTSGRDPQAPKDDGKYPFSSLSGEILPVFYVRDVEKSVDFYTQRLGFRLNHFHDYESGESVPTWGREEPAVYAELAAENQKFALHRRSAEKKLEVGGMRHYFGVLDVKKHHRAVQSRGVEVSDLIDRPWMTMFKVTDLDGHDLYFFTRPDENRGR